jgi:hypothetical protein
VTSAAGAPATAAAAAPGTVVDLRTGPQLSPALTVTVHVVNTGPAPSPPGNLQLRGTLVDPEGLPVGDGDAVDVLLASVPLPALPGVTGDALGALELDVPLTQGVAQALLVPQGWGVLLRAVVSADAFEHDLLNNAAGRTYHRAEVEASVVAAPGH